MKDNINNRGFIDNTYLDCDKTPYRIIQSSNVSGGVLIVGGSIYLSKKDVKMFYKNIKRIGKGKRK